MKRYVGSLLNFVIFLDLNKKQTIIVLFSLFLKCHEYKLFLHEYLKNASAVFV